VGRPGPDTFWWPITENIFDARPTEYNTVHFELALDKPVPESTLTNGGSAGPWTFELEMTP
jgi:hypothetical protein